MRKVKNTVLVAMIFSLWPICIGTAIVIRFHDKDYDYPFWKFGQYSILLGGCYLLLLVIMWAFLRRFQKSEVEKQLL